MKGPSEDGLRNAVRRGRELGRALVVAGCVPQGQKNHPDLQGLSIVGVRGVSWLHGGMHTGFGTHHSVSCNVIFSQAIFIVIVCQKVNPKRMVGITTT